MSHDLSQHHLPPIGTSYGAILLGSFAAIGLSGIAGVQCIVYFRMYPNDTWKDKLLVSVVWTLDIFHTILICASIWYYFITYFGDPERIAIIPWPIAFTVLLTAVITFIVHCFFAGKILRSSQNNWYIVVPIIFLSFLRSFAATVTTVEMTRLKHYSDYAKPYPGWVFTTGLALSTTVDILIMLSLCFYLQRLRSRMGSTSMIKLVDTLTLYTLENGALTCVATTASLICWLKMNNNLVFLGLHFMITKLYANSLLASLNTRKELTKRQRRNNGSPYENEHSGSMQAVSTAQFVSPRSPRRAHALALQHPIQARRSRGHVPTATWTSIFSRVDASGQKSRSYGETTTTTPRESTASAPVSLSSYHSEPRPSEWRTSQRLP
jgi:hypothetical protein